MTIPNTSIWSLDRLLQYFAAVRNSRGGVDTATLDELPETAKWLFQRIRSVVSLTEPGAPSVFAEESFPDVNIVAEYLDGQLDDASLKSEYEAIVLQSEMLLAELANDEFLLLDVQNGIESTLPIPPYCRHRLYYIEQTEENLLDSNVEKNSFVNSQLSPAKIEKKDSHPFSSGQKTKNTNESHSLKFSFLPLAIPLLILFGLLVFRIIESGPIDEHSRTNLPAPSNFERFPIRQTSGLLTLEEKEESAPVEFGKTDLPPFRINEPTKKNEATKHNRSNRSGRSLVSSELFIIPSENNAVFQRKNRHH